jgi:hypothetical protein
MPSGGAAWFAAFAIEAPGSTAGIRRTRNANRLGGGGNPTPPALDPSTSNAKT